MTEFGDALRRALEQHDATPETVALGPLATTDEGLRVLTRVWDAKKATTGVGASAPTAATPAAKEPGPITAEQITNHPAFSATPSPADTPAGNMTPLEMQDMGHAMTLIAPDMETLSEAIEPKSSRSKVLVVAGAFALVAVAAALVVWQPWAASDTGGAVEKASDAIASSQAAAAPDAAGERVVAAPAGEQPGDDPAPRPVVAVAAPTERSAGAVAQPGTPPAPVPQGEPDTRPETPPPEPPAVAHDSGAGSAGAKAAPEAPTETAEEAAERKASELARREAEERKKKAEEEAQALIAKARSHLRRGRYESAIKRLRQAQKIDGVTNAEIRGLMEKCSAGIRSREVGSLVSKAESSLAQKEYDAALASLGEAAKLDPGNGKVKKLRTECRKRKKQSEADAKEAKELEQLKFGDDKAPEGTKKKDDKELEQLKF